MYAEDWRTAELTPDCQSCAALCCIALDLEKGAHFALDKPAGLPCPNLAQNGHTCSIHTDLKSQGFTGCIRYDCFGAGQRTTTDLFDGKSWRDHPELLDDMIDGFLLMRNLHDHLATLAFCATLPLSIQTLDSLEKLISQLAPPEGSWTHLSLSNLDLSTQKSAFTALLPQIRSELPDPSVLAAPRRTT